MGKLANRRKLHAIRKSFYYKHQALLGYADLKCQILLKSEVRFGENPLFSGVYVSAGCRLHPFKKSVCLRA